MAKSFAAPFHAALGLLGALALPAAAYPPGSPMSDFGPSQISLGLFADHSGQDLFEEGAPSVLNTFGLSLDYAPWPYLALGMFGGGAELDTDVPDSRLNDPKAVGFNTGLSLYGGAAGKLATPRFGDAWRLVVHGSSAWFNAEDDFGNVKRGILSNAGGSLQFLVRGRLNLVLGGEFQVIPWGEQLGPNDDRAEAFGISEQSGVMDYMRGLVGVEWFFKGKNQPFVSVAFRPTGAIGWHDHLGLRNASVSISLGAIATLPGKGKNRVDDEDEPPVED